MTNNERTNHLPQSYDSEVQGAFPATQMGAGQMTMSSEAAREIGEVQGAIVVAQRCPRNEERAFKEIMNACQRRTLAESATYAFPRGGKQVKGPSIRLAEVLARYWGNIQYGVRELVRTKEETLFEAYCWDVQTNTRISRRFSQRHWRDTRQGGYALTDERDIYEAVANSGSRRLRACILQVIPGDLVEEALRVCAQTKLGKTDIPMKDRIRQLVVAFDKFGVTQEMLEKYLDHKLDATTPEEFVDLRDIYTSMKDGVVTRDDYFDAPKPSAGSTDALNDKFGSEAEPKPAKKKPVKKKATKKKAAKAEPPEEDLEVNGVTPPPRAQQSQIDFESAPGGGLHA